MAGPTSSAPTQGNDVWNDPRNPMCQQGCTYEKANESLTLLLNYTQEKLALLGDQIKLQTPDGDQAVLEELGSFCFKSEVEDLKVKECWDRYVRYQGLAMAKMRAAIIQNSTSASKFLSKKVNHVTGAEEGVNLATVPVDQRKDAAPFKQVVIYLPSFDELQVLKAQHDIRMKSSIGNEYQEWVGNYPKKPSKDDFFITKKIRRDPSNPSAGFFDVIATHPDGSPMHDEKAFEFATKAYENSLKNLGVDQKNFARAFAKKPPQSPKLPVQLSKISRQAFNNVRAGWVEQINKGMGKISGRKPSANTPATTKANPGAPTAPTSPTTGEVTKSFQKPLRPVLTGNEKIDAPPTTRENQYNTLHMNVDADTSKREVLEFMRDGVETQKEQAPEHVDAIPPIEP